MWNHAELAPEATEDKTIRKDSAEQGLTAREQSRETRPPTADGPEEPTQSGVESDR